MKLNLPAYNISVRRQPDGSLQVHDRLRGKYVALTPEEWVRQHFVEYLINEKGFTPAWMANEVGLRLNGTLRRCDTVAYGRDMRPLVVVEYKAPDVEITQAVFDQIARYNLVLHAEYLIVSNGLAHYCCRYNHAAGKYTFMREIPCWDQCLKK